MLEPAVTALAADRASADHLAEIGVSLGRMRQANGHEEFVRFDAEFHDLVGEASGNETLASMVRGVSSRSLRARVWRDILEADASERTMAEHERIYAALQVRDGASAQAAALLHVRSTEIWLRQVLDADRAQTS